MKEEKNDKNKKTFMRYMININSKEDLAARLSLSAITLDSLSLSLTDGQQAKV